MSNNKTDNKVSKSKEPSENKLIISLFNGWMSTIRTLVTILLAVLTISTIIITYFGLSGIKDYQFVMRYAAEVKEQKRSIDSIALSINLTRSRLDTFEIYYSKLKKEISEIPKMQQSIKQFSENINHFHSAFTTFKDTLGEFKTLYKEFSDAHKVDKEILAGMQLDVDTLIINYELLETQLVELSDLFLYTGATNIDDLNSRERLLLYLLADNLKPADPEISMIIGLRWLEIGNYEKALERFEYVEKNKDKISKDSWIIRQLALAMNAVKERIKIGAPTQIPISVKSGIILKRGDQEIDLSDFIVNLAELLCKKGYVEVEEASAIFKPR